MKKTTVKGTNDYLPKEARLRDYMEKTILSTYTAAGFERIMTPAVEDIENLDKSDGGDNLNLIFKILKRGEKLNKAIESGEEKELSDMGLRYDLTLPLSRYYANNREKLLMPAKFIQVDRVYRAERPQKGRLREFVQCDIDIIGSASPSSEVELIHTTAKALMALSMTGFTVKINDRRILHTLLSSCGFKKEEWDSVCITFDKLDKIGGDGVREELEDKGFDKTAIGNFTKLLENPITLEDVKKVCDGKIGDIEYIIDSAKELSGGKYEIKFDISLVRGQGYYTGTVFEIVSDKFRGSIAGGGRYDNLIGKFTGENVSAVGFSIGFERIFSILSDMETPLQKGRERVALMYDKGEIVPAVRAAEEMRDKYDISVVERPKKLSKFLDKLLEDGYYGFCYLDNPGEIRELK